MTLITAWLTTNIRTIASDGRCMGIGNAPSVCQKIFANNNLAIGIYGSLSPNNRERIKKYLYDNPEAEKDQFINSIQKGLTDIPLGDKEINFNSRSVSHFLIIPRSSSSEIFCIERDTIPIRKTLMAYKGINQKSLQEELFFSEQLKEDDEIDVEYQEKLEEYFNKTLVEIKFDVENITQASVLNLFKEFYSKVYFVTELKKESIGGDIVYIAFSIKNETWYQYSLKPIPYGEWLDRKQEEDLKNMFKID